MSTTKTTSRRHWTEADFVVTSMSGAYDGRGNVNRFGYCRKCYGDMQSFSHGGKAGPIAHHNSHKHAKRLGLWGIR